MLATLLLLADGRLPSGGHAHSGGLEPQVSAARIRDVDDVAAFLHGKLATSGLVAAAFAAATCHRAAVGGSALPRAAASGTASAGTASAGAASAGAEGDAGLGRNEAVAALDAGLDARTPSPALRRASRAQGRALLRAGRAMWPGPSLNTPLREPHHPVALGLVAAAAGLGPLEAALAAAHGAVTGPASAAVRLLGLDPYAVHAVLARLAPEIDRVAADAAGRAGDTVDELPASGAPLLDVGAEHHATWEVRLFAS